MKIQTLKEIEDAIGGRKETGNRKVRLTFYLNSSEARLIKDYASEQDKSISQIVRSSLKKLIQK